MTNQNRGQALLALLTNPTPDDAACQLCLSQLDDYVRAQLSGRQAAGDFAWLLAHLDGCVACAAAYALLYEVTLADENGRLPRPAAVPEPDLSFLRLPADWRTALHAALRPAPGRLTIQFSAALNHLLAPAPAAALSRAGAGDGRYAPKLLELTTDQAQAAAVPFTLAVYADRQQPDACLVEITIAPPGQSWPDLGGRSVTLTAGPYTRTAATDDWGTAVFPDVPRAELDNLRLDVNLIG